MGLNLNLNDPNNSIANFFGLCANGTSRLFDIATTFIAFFVVIWVLDELISETIKEGSPLVAATILFVPAIMVAYWWYRRANADNRIRRVLKNAPPSTTVEQIKAAVTVQDLV